MDTTVEYPTTHTKIISRTTSADGTYLTDARVRSCPFSTNIYQDWDVTYELTKDPSPTQDVGKEKSSVLNDITNSGRMGIPILSHQGHQTDGEYTIKGDPRGGTT